MRKKKRKVKKKLLALLIPVCIVLILVLLCYFGYTLIFKNNEKKFLETINTSNYANITKYATYGIHMNIEGNINFKNAPTSLSLVLTNGKEEIEIPWIQKTENNSYTFKTSEFINEGINLEKLPIGEYYLLIKSIEKNEHQEDTTNYYSVKNQTEYKNIEYYTLTKNNKNNKINIEWNTSEDLPTLRFTIKETKLPDNVYDITIDPGHDVTDSGTTGCTDGSTPSSIGYCYSGETIKENNMNLEIAKILKTKLESLGYKVIMTRNTEDDEVKVYDPMGSATMANDTKSKFSLAIHHNASGMGGYDYLKGLELYIANDTNTDLAKLFVENIINEANTVTSYKALYKIDDGIYQRFFSENDIDEEHPNWNTSMIYYYYIREVGGISTHAAHNTPKGTYPMNEHYNSNSTAEPYLFELGYLDNYNDLHNLINNREKYADGIVKALQTYLESE